MKLMKLCKKLNQKLLCNVINSLAKLSNFYNMKSLSSNREKPIWNLTTHVANSLSCSFDNVLAQIEPQLGGIEAFINIDENENLQYFSVSDHLGSSSFITDAGGEAVQHLQYLPFGEHFVNQTSTSWETPYKFSGKEKDQETGCSYFGARYYDSDLSIWLSVDPLVDKYPSMSAYMYCAGNPVMLVDPDGNEPGPPYKIYKGNPVMMKALYDAAHSGIYQHYINNGNPVFMTVNFNGEEQRVFTINGGDPSKPAVNIYNNVSLNGISTSHTVGGESPMIQTVAAKTVDAIPVVIDAPEMKLIPMQNIWATAGNQPNDIGRNSLTGRNNAQSLAIAFNGSSGVFAGDGSSSRNAIHGLVGQMLNNSNQTFIINVGTNLPTNNNSGQNYVQDRINTIFGEIGKDLQRRGKTLSDVNFRFTREYNQNTQNTNYYIEE